MIALTFSPEHITRGGNPAQYVTLSDALTGRTVGRLHAIYTPTGTEYRDFLTDEPLSAQDGSAAALESISLQTQRRASRPPRKHQKPQRGAYRGRHPWPLPYPMQDRRITLARQRLVAKLQARREAVAS